MALQSAALAQIGIGTNNPNPSAALEVASTDKGLLIPQLTKAQRKAMANPATGLLVIQTDDTTGFYYNAGTPTTPNWLNLSAYTLQQNINTNGKYISGDGSNTGIQVSGDGLVAASGFYSEVPRSRSISPGAKMVWAPDRAAFRVGRITSNLWNDGFTGSYSVAMGFDAAAAGRASFAVGERAQALAHNSVAMGYNVTTGAYNGSFIFGDVSDAGPLNNTASNQMMMRFGGGYQLYAGHPTIPALSIARGNKVGIGVTNPVQSLEVLGNIAYTGNLIMGVQYVFKNYNISGNSRGVNYCGCPVGTKLIGGGGGHRDYNSALSDIEVAYSGPAPDNTNEWRLMVQNTSGSSRALLIYAICAKVQ